MALILELLPVYQKFHAAGYLAHKNGFSMIRVVVASETEINPHVHKVSSITMSEMSRGKIHPSASARVVLAVKNGIGDFVQHSRF